MSDGINIIVDGGSTEERNYVSNVIETSLQTAGFKAVNNIVITDEDTATLLDYAKRANPDLFEQTIEINLLETENIEDDDEENIEVSDD